MRPLHASLRRLFDAHREHAAETQDDRRLALLTAPPQAPVIDEAVPPVLRHQRLETIEGICAKAALDLEEAEALAREDRELALVAFEIRWAIESLERCAQRARARREIDHA